MHFKPASLCGVVVTKLASSVMVCTCVEMANEVYHLLEHLELLGQSVESDLR